MMSRTLKIMLLLCLVVVAKTILAQTGGKSQGAAKPKRMFMPQGYLGRSRLSGGPIKKQTLDSLLKQGISVYDSVGNRYKVLSFDFSYAERKLYEDSAANLQFMMDFQSEYCKGDTLSSVLTVNNAVTLSTYAQTISDVEAGGSLSIYDRTKPGDTIYIDHVRVTKLPGNKLISLPDSVAIMAKGMKFYVVK